ncbi:MAG: bifunctional riboflavin kinase/FAD synthetase [Alphaproteobacteria bacterium]
MQYFEDYKTLPQNAKDAVIVIGNFDGVHLGHQALLTRARDLANALGKSLGVLTFEPHPRRLFHPDELPNRITPMALKAERLAASGVDILYALPFNWDFASQSAADFVQHILIDGLNAAHIIVGFDFKFGQLRQGTPDTIEAAGLDVTVVDEVTGKAGEDLSSSRVRQLIRHGKIEEANAVLGWGWELRGEVFKGDQRGRELGYPTANMKLEDHIHPAYGVYACFARLEGESDWVMGATNIGIRPMFEVPLAQVETFIFDFNREIYGKTLCVRPIQYLRGEAKFNSLDDLIVQMEKDCAISRKILNKISM